MTRHTKVFFFLGIAGLAAGLAVLWHFRIQGIGRLTAQDVREIHGAVRRSALPGWNPLHWGSVRNWPKALNLQFSFKIESISESTVSSFTIHPDGSQDDLIRKTTVRYKLRSAEPAQICRVQKQAGQWTVIPGSPDDIFYDPPMMIR